MTRAFRPESLVIGLTLIALGVVWVVANLGYVDLLSTLRRWWPSILIVWGGLELYDSLVARSAERRAGLQSQSGTGAGSREG